MKNLSEEISLLNQAASEIKMLMKQNELMRARLDMFDAMNAILHTQVATRSEGFTPDLVLQIEKHCIEKENQIAKQQSNEQE